MFTRAGFAATAAFRRRRWYRDRDPARAEALMRDHLETVKKNMFERARASAG